MLIRGIQWQLFTNVKHPSISYDNNPAMSKQSINGYLRHFSSFSQITQIWHFWHFSKSAKNKVTWRGNLTQNTNHHWIKIVMPYPLSQFVISCQSQILRPLKSHTLLNLQIIQVQFGPLTIQNMSGGLMGKAFALQSIDGWCCEFDSHWK